MKKLYMKPRIESESFELSQSIAGNCGGMLDGTTTNHSTEITCNASIPGMGSFFSAGVSGCVNMPEQLIGYCYNNTDGILVIFGS